MSKSKTKSSSTPKSTTFSSSTLIFVAIALVIGYFSRDLSNFLVANQESSVAKSSSENSETANAINSVIENQFWELYRYGDIRYVPKKPEKNVAQLVEIAQKLFDDETIQRLTTHTGTELSNLSQLQEEAEAGFLICLNAEEKFVWPAMRPGEVVKTFASPDQSKGSKRQLFVKTLSVRPRVFEVPNFLTDEECDHLVDIAKKSNLEKSKVGGDTGDKGEYRDVRTSSQTWIAPNDPRNNEITDRIRSRVLDLVKLPQELAEAIQLVHYDKKQHYFGHHDYAHKWESVDNEYIQAGGNRFVTVIFYLNNVKAGGHTAFPFANSTKTPLLDENGKERIWVTSDDGEQVYYGYFGCDGEGLMVPPIKGSAVIFYNLQEQHTEDALPDSYTLHAGCDVEEGEKYMANVWIRNKLVNGRMYN